MAYDVGIKLTLDGANAVASDLQRVGNATGDLGGKAKLAAAGFDGLRSALGAVASVGSVYALVKMADAVTTLNTQLRLASASASEAARSYSALFDIAQKGRVSFTELGTTYAAIARAGTELGISQSRLLTVTQSISQAMTIGGGSAASMQAALVQLGQGLSSGVLRGEELNSILEQTPRLAKALADGLGVPIGELRKLGEAGQLTAEKVIGALEKAGPQLAKEMASATLTVGQAFTLLQNSATNFVGTADAASGASTTLAGAMQSLSQGIDSVGKAINEHRTTFTLITAGLAGSAVATGLRATAGGIAAVWAAVTLGGSAAVTAAIAGLGAIVGFAAAAGKELSRSETIIKLSLEKVNNQIAAAEKSRNYAAIVELRKTKESLEKDLQDRRQKVIDASIGGSVPSPDRTLEREAARAQATADKELLAIRQKLSGVDSSYLETLQKLNELRLAGNVGEQEYIALVSQLAEKNYKKAASSKTAGDAEAKHAERIRMGREAVMMAGDALTDANEAYQKSLRDAAAEHEKYIASLERSAEAVGAHVRRLQTEDEALGISAAQHISLAQAIEQVEIARLQDLAAVQLSYGDESAAAAIQREIDARKQLVTLIASKEVREANATAAKEAEKEWRKTAEKINDSITDALMRGFESGKDFAANLRDTVVNMFKTLVLRPVVSAVVNPVAQGITGALGMSGAANAASGVGNLAAAGGFAGGLSAFGGAFSTGAALGTEAFSAGVTMMAEATGMSSFMAGAGQALGAVGPAGWAAMAALAVLSLRNGYKSSANTGDSSATYSSNGALLALQTTNGLSKATTDMAAALQASYLSAAKSLGVALAQVNYNVNTNSGREGANPNTIIDSTVGGRRYTSGEISNSDSAAMQLAASRAVFNALQGSDLPAYLAKMFDGLTAGELSQDQINNTLAYAQTLKQVRDGLLETREPLQILKDNVAEGIAALGTSSETFKTDFVAAIDGGITPEKLAQWQGLQNAMTELAAASGKAAGAVKDVGRSIADIANERQRLQDQLDELTMSSTELLAKQRNAIDASNRALFDQVQVAQTLRDELNQRNDLELQLLQLQGNTTELRRRELQAIAPANQGLQESIYALQDAKAAQDAYNTALSNAQSRMSAASSALESAQNAVDAIRNTGTDQYLSALDKVAQAQDAIAQAAQSASQKMAQLGQSLRDFVTREVLSGAAGMPSIAVANAAFARTLAQAKGGNADAIADLENRGRIAIDAARAGSTTSAQFQAIRNMVLQSVSGVAATLPNATQAQGADLQQRLIDAQTDLAEALRVANAIGAPLQRAQADLITRFGAAQSALASAQAEYAAASAVLEAIKNNTAQTAANVLDLNGNLVVQLHASAQSEITKLIKVIGDDTGLAPDLKVLALMGTESVSKTIDLLATSNITPDLKALALASSSAVTKTIGLVVSSSLSGDDKALALMVSDSVAKNIALAATSNLAPDLKTLALLESGSISKYIGLVANSSLSPDDKTLALMASSSVVKTIGAALGSLDATALSIALAQSDTLTRTISAVGGTLTADQRTVLQALTGASSVSVNVSGTTTANVMFDPADPVRSVWTAIKDATLQSAQDAAGMHSALTWIASMVSNMLNHISTVHVVFNRGDGQVFAKGGVFTNRVIDQPTTFDQGLMGEAGPEAIMPLRRGPDGSLGVVAAIDYRQFGRGNDALVAEIRTLREENRAQASAIVNLNQRMTKIFERWDGNGLPTERVEA